MKIVTLLFTATVFLNSSGAMERGRLWGLRTPEMNPPVDPNALRNGSPKDRPSSLQMPGAMGRGRHWNSRNPEINPLADPSALRIGIPKDRSSSSQIPGAIRGGRHCESRKRERNPPTDPNAMRIAIPKDRPILLQMPGDHVVMGILREEKRGLPSWLNPRSPGFEMPERIFINEPGEPRIYGLKADIGETLHNNNDPHIRGYTCFIRTSMHILTASLEPISRPDITMADHKMPYVFLRTEPHNLIYGGPLTTLAEDKIPNWINKYDL